MTDHQCGHSCSSHQTNPSVHQSLDELDFERGIWSAALEGDIIKVETLLNKGVSADVLDNSGYSALAS